MSVINTNVKSLIAQDALSVNNRKLDASMQRLSTGLRINSAKDDAAGLAISNRMTSQISGLNVAIRNANDGISMMQTAEGALTEVTDMLQRMRELSLQSASDVNNDNDRAYLNAEVQSLKTEIDRVVSTTQFNGKNLLDGTMNAMLQIGEKAGQTMNVAIGNLSTAALGTSSSSAVTTAATTNMAQGVAALSTVSQMAFNGNDTYGFTLKIGNGTGAATVDLAISGGVVAGNDAEDIAAKIRAAAAAAAAAGGATADTKAAMANLDVKANGNVLTITNKLGDKIEVSGFSSTANGTASYASVSGAGTSKLLTDTAATTSVANTNASSATAATGSLTLQSGKSYSFRLNDQLVSISNLDSVGGTSTADALAAMKLAIGAGASASTGAAGVFSLADATGKQIAITNFSATSSPAGSAGAMVMTTRVDADADVPSKSFANGGADTASLADVGDIVQMSFTQDDAQYSFKIGAVATAVVVDARSQSLQAAIAAARDQINADTAGLGAKVLARVVDGKLELEAKVASVAIDTFASTGKAAVVAGTATLGATNLVTAGAASTTNGVQATTSQMALSFSQSDNYSFTLTNASGGGTTTISATVNGNDYSALVSAVNSNTTATGITARVDGNNVLLEKANGAGFTLANMSSTGSGKITATNAASQGASASLDDSSAVTGATTASAGRATATSMVLTNSADETKVGFTISDGQTNAVVRTGAWTVAGGADILAEVNRALTTAGSSITAAYASGKLTLTNATGGKIDLSNYSSDGTTTLTATPASGQGVGKVLDDSSLGGLQASVSAVAITTQAGASAAVSTIDRALENINSQRANLGAQQNRLTYTVNNLSNIATNTSQARSRILDTDYATETTNMAKSQIIQQAATAMLAQANQSGQSVLALLK
ncbi:MAG: flagellin [Limnohabitans sp.]|jgi:flagellin